MKKILVVLLVIVVVFIGLLVAAPLLFKDTLLGILDKEIEKNVRAEVYFDPGKVGLSLIKNFPQLTLTLEDFGIIGVGEFAGDTLADIDAFDLTINLKSLISGDQVRLNSVNLVNPRLMIIVLNDGNANYDISIDSEGELSDKDTVESSMSIGIDHWSIRNGKIAYFDQASNLLVGIEGLNHTGSGDFNTRIFDMSISTSIEDLMISYENITYLQNKTLEADMIIHVDLDQSKYTFKENKVRLNDFSTELSGYVTLLPEGYDMDISLEGKDNSIKSLLSLVPGAYTEGYENISAEGMFNFTATISGIYNEEKSEIPAYQLQLIAKNGVIQYPELPEAIRNIQMDMLVNNEGNDVNQTRIDINKIHLEFGNNPVDATLKIKNLVDYAMTGDIRAQINLDDITKIYPLKDTELGGKVDMDVHIDGVYDSVNHTLPVSGKMNINDLSYQGPELPLNFAIHQASAELNTKQITVHQFDGDIGNSHLNLKGSVNNYLAYFLDDQQPLKGDFDFRSRRVDLNEWMAEEETDQVEEGDTSEFQVLEVPRNIDFMLRSEMDLVFYDNLELKDVKGKIRIRDGIVNLDKLDFNTLGGDFILAGSYNTQDLEKPAFDFQLDIEKLSIPDAYKAFFTIKQLAPIANLMEGDFSTDFSLSGRLKQNMMPDLTTFSGSGVLEILNAAVRGSESKVISGITSVTNLSQESSNVTLKDVLMSTQITDGRVLVEPFTIRMGSQQAVVAGSHGLDGSLDYRIKLDIPPGLVESATTLVSSAIGQDLNVNAKDVKLNLGIGGTYKDPKIKILGADTGGTEEAAKDALKAVVEEEKEKLSQEAEKKMDEEADKLLEKTDDLIEDEELKEEVDKAKETLKKFFKKKGG